MDLSAFYGVVATVDFALLGLWWVTVQARPDLRANEGAQARMAYLVSLQFVVPGTAALLAQVAPGLAAVWRVSFALAGVTGIAAVVILAPALTTVGARREATFMRWAVIPLYGLLTVIAAVPGLFGSRVNALQVEAVFFCLLVLLGAETAWAAAMTPDRETGERRTADGVQAVGAIQPQQPMVAGAPDGRLYSGSVDTSAPTISIDYRP